MFCPFQNFTNIPSIPFLCRLLCLFLDFGVFFSYQNVNVNMACNHTHTHDATVYVCVILDFTQSFFTFLFIYKVVFFFFRKLFSLNVKFTNLPLYFSLVSFIYACKFFKISKINTYIINQMFNFLFRNIKLYIKNKFIN